METTVEMDDGARLVVKLLGEDPCKELVIVHHGAPGVSNRSEPEASFAFLADRFRVLVFDARGSGQSEAKAPYTHARWAADVDGLRQWAGAEKIVMAGGSYGGFIALEYALAYPDRVLAVVLRDTAAVGGPILERSIQRALTSDKVQVDEARIRRMFSGAMFDDADMAQGMKEIAPLYAGTVDPEEARKEAGPVAPRAWTFHAATHNAAFSQNMPTFDLRPRLHEIQAPTLVTVGRHDWITPVSSSEEIKANIPNSELVIFEKSGHSPPSDEPRLFRETVNRFLTKTVLPST